MDAAERRAGVRENFRWFCDLISDGAAGGHAAFANYGRSVTPERLERTTRWFDDVEADLHAALGG